MDAETVDDLVASRNPAAKEIDEGEDELEELLREAGFEDDEIEVINPKTGSREHIAKDDPSYYESSGFKGRRYKGSPWPKPKDIPTFLWRGVPRLLCKGRDVRPGVPLASLWRPLASLGLRASVLLFGVAGAGLAALQGA